MERLVKFFRDTGLLLMVLVRPQTPDQSEISRVWIEHGIKGNLGGLICGRDKVSNWLRFEKSRTSCAPAVRRECQERNFISLMSPSLGIRVSCTISLN